MGIDEILYRGTPIIVFVVSMAGVYGLKYYLARRFGAGRKTRYKKGLLKIAVGAGFVATWLSGGGFIAFGAGGIMCLVFGFVQFSRFGKKPRTSTDNYANGGE